MAEKTLGELRVRTDFNAGHSTEVDFIKKVMAEMINLCETNKELDPRLCSIAQTKLEEAAMFAVKLLTTQK